MNFYNKYILPKLLNSRMQKKDLDALRPDVIKDAYGIVLEIGFGSGLNLPYYKNIAKLYTLDPSKELYDLAKEKIKQVSFPTEHFVAGAEKIPLKDNSVDCVVSTWNLCTIPSPEIALREIFLVLKPNGKFIFIEHGKSDKVFPARLQKIITPISKHFTGGCHLDRNIETLIIQTGFTIEKLKKFRSKPLLFMYKGTAIARK